ncbi:MAG: hypothetical protein A2583_00640 [Bdellovibrionales bacterium RIFOXYD1_FULL_53_11]|nr:MAG: hypothetical protein A2583_00640 [Bdellovibrionales bacterium RIFOXYD1_FULL_53_11]
MKKSVIVICSFIAASLLAGCNSYNTPEGVLNMAMKALKKNNHKMFFKTLAGDAKLLYGDQEGFDNLRAELQKKKLVPFPKDLLGTRLEDACTVKQFNVTVDDVSRDKARLIHVAITCRQCLPARHAVEVGDDEYVRCHIEDIKL